MRSNQFSGTLLWVGGVSKKVTDIDYIIADWDDILRYYEDDLFEKNKEEFISSLWQFVYKYVDEMSAGKYFCFLKEIKQLA